MKVQKAASMEEHQHVEGKTTQSSSEAVTEEGGKAKSEGKNTVEVISESKGMIPKIRNSKILKLQ